ncbi:MAG TPA: hypothetical protein EYN91_15975 [Candidatus Melainabacteria bacterium]|nr:hypothetical protein [Candidatus Melainabacteria bacterium]HIN63743.1 hypothetical protein [Candidatus Obscuribacterales bacterium]
MPFFSTCLHWRYSQLLTVSTYPRKSSLQLRLCTISSAHFLKKIDYPGINNFTQFNYDGSGRDREIVETVSGTVTSTQRYLWNGPFRAEERDALGSVAKQFFTNGEKRSSFSYFYCGNHLGSTTEITNSSGVLQCQYQYDPYGRKSKTQGAFDGDFQFARYFFHSRSSLNLTATRVFSSTLGRWLSNDYLSAPNSSNYVSNNPVSFIDPLGLWKDPSSASGYSGWKPTDPIMGNMGGESAYASGVMSANGFGSRNDSKWSECIFNCLHHAIAAASTSMNSGGGALGGALAMGGGIGIEAAELAGNMLNYGIGHAYNEITTGKIDLTRERNQLNESLSSDTIVDLNNDAMGAQAAADQGASGWGKVLDQIIDNCLKQCCKESKTDKPTAPNGPIK